MPQAPPREKARNIRSPELEGVFLPGDIYRHKNGFYLPKNGAYYKFEPEEFEQYKKNTLFQDYGRRAFNIDRISRTVVPIGDIQENQIDNTGNFKVAKPRGGIDNAFSSGFLDDAVVLLPYDRILLNETFETLKQELGGSGWDRALDTVHFTHRFEDSVVKEYESKDTAVSIQTSFKKADVFIDRFVRDHPLVQLNGVGHSLGGLIVLRMAMRHPGVFNSVSVLACPAYGIEPTEEMEKLITVVHGLLKAKGIEEELSQSLLELWGDADYRKKLDTFTESFTKAGRRLTSVFVENDRISTKKNATLKGAENIELSRSSFSDSITDPFGLKAHGRPLREPASIEAIVRSIGKNPRL